MIILDDCLSQLTYTLRFHDDDQYVAMEHVNNERQHKDVLLTVHNRTNVVMEYVRLERRLKAALLIVGSDEADLRPEHFQTTSV